MYANDKTNNNTLNSSMNQQIGTTDHSINFDLKNNSSNISIINNSKIHENLTTASQIEMDDMIFKMMTDDSFNKKNFIHPTSQPQHTTHSSAKLISSSNLQSSQQYLQEQDIYHVTPNVEIPNVYKYSQINSNHNISSNSHNNYSLSQSPNIHQIKDNHDNNSSFQQKNNILNENNNHNNFQNNGQNLLQSPFYYNQQYSNSDIRTTDPNKNRKSTSYKDLQNSTINGNTGSLTNLNSSMNNSIKYGVHQNYVEQPFSKE